MWIRRSPAVIAEWRGPDTFVRHLDNGLLCKVGTGTLAFLDGVAGWCEHTSTSADEADVERMVSLGLLESSDDASPPAADSADPTWAPLGWCTRVYHSQTLDAHYLTGGHERDVLAAHLAEVAEPFVPKRYGQARYTPFAADAPIGGVDLETVLRARRTTRQFTDEPVTRAQLSTILRHAFGIQGYQDGGPFGPVPVKASPAAGARHEIEAYVVSPGTGPIERGVYHYHSADHSIARVADLPAEGLDEIVYRQPACTGAPLVIFSTAVLSRLSGKYRHPRAYRLWMYDIGHVGQTLALTATALGLGVFQTIAFRDTALAGLIGADPRDEFPSYLFSVGHPASTESASRREWS